MIICISGFPGSGKTYAVKKVIEQSGPPSVLRRIGPIPARYSENFFYDQPLVTYYAKTDLHVLGPYPEGRNIVGMDVFLADTVPVIRDILRFVPNSMNILMEGYFFSFNPKKWFDLSKEIGGQWKFCSLDTRFWGCIRNLRQRKGNRKHPVTESMRSRWTNIQRNRLKMTELGLDTEVLGATPWKRILELVSSSVSA